MNKNLNSNPVMKTGKYLLYLLTSLMMLFIGTMDTQAQNFEATESVTVEPLVLGNIFGLKAEVNQANPIVRIENKGKSNQVTILTQEYYNRLNPKMKTLIDRSINYTVE